MAVTVEEMPRSRLRSKICPNRDVDIAPYFEILGKPLHKKNQMLPPLPSTEAEALLAWVLSGECYSDRRFRWSSRAFSWVTSFGLKLTATRIALNGDSTFVTIDLSSRSPVPPYVAPTTQAPRIA